MENAVSRSNYRVRKFSVIEAEWPIYEVVCNEAVIFDVTWAAGRFEIAFHKAAAQSVMDLDMFTNLIEQCKARLREDGVSEIISKNTIA
jgi:hypothetical protein